MLMLYNSDHFAVVQIDISCFSTRGRFMRSAGAVSQPTRQPLKPCPIEKEPMVTTRAPSSALSMRASAGS